MSRGPLVSPLAVLFDLDGTLVDTVPARIEAWRSALLLRRIKPDEAQLAGMIGSDGKYLAKTLAAAAGVSLSDDEADALDRRQGELFDALNTDPRPLPGVSELLAALDDRGCPWAIATSSRKEQIAASVAALQLARDPVIVDGSEVRRAKPAPDLLLKAARELGVPPEACWYVGDSTWDMLAATKAAMTAVGVLAGSAVTESDLARAGATTVMKDLADVQALIPTDS